MKAMMFLKRALAHPYTAFALRLYIGGLFIYAGMYKVNYPAEFAETIASYQIVPYWAIESLAVVLPWVELITGTLLIAGIRARSATLLAGFMILFFTAALAVNLLRDAPISCGCFKTLGETISWKTLVRDVTWMLMTLHIFIYDKSFQLENRFTMKIGEIET